MTFGIDIASSQRDINLSKAKAEGVEFVIVKMGGFNVTPQYVAPHYKTQVDRAVAAGLPKGHYYLIGGGQTFQSPTMQARYFVANLYRFDVTRDVLALDNEGLDSNGYLFDDAEAAEFCAEVIRLTGIKPNQLWHYAGAQDYRNLGPWPKVAALGVRFWWAAYGKYPTGKTPDHQPDLDGSIPRWDVHQFTSKAKVAGYELDGNYTPHTINVLFGGEVATEAQIRSWIAGYPRAWDQLCQALMWQLANRFGTVRSTPVSAILAYHVERQAGRMRTGTPPPGSFVYWDIGADGHVGFVMNGGRVLMASRRVTEELVASDAGIHTVAGYTAATGADYLGWSYQNGGNTVPFSTSSVAGGGGGIIEEDDMFEQKDRDKLNATYAGVYGARNLTKEATPLGWVNIDGDSQTAKYGLLPTVIHNQTLIVQQSGRIAALESVVKQLAETPGSPVDLTAVLAAAKAGVDEAIAGLEIPTVDEIADAVVGEQHDRLAD